MQTEEEKMTFDKTTEDTRFAEFVDYQEFYKAWMSENRANQFHNTKHNETKEKTAIDFSRFAPNATQEVRQAFKEASEETGYIEGERMDYISQVLVHQVENRQNGVSNYTDVFGSSIASALQTAKGILYDLENPLMSVSQRGENAAKYTEQEKEFYISFIKKLEVLQESSGRNNTAENVTEDTSENLDYAQSFTLEEWDDFLAKFDAAEEESTILTSESTMCTYPTSAPDEEDIRYITWYTEEGIFCRKAGQTEGYEWSIAFENREQYDKVMEFIGQFPADWNMRFAANENFWNDFLNDEIDMEGFMEFINETNKGVPDFSITVDDSVYIDKNKMQWAKYTNPLGARFYTAEEMQKKREEWRRQVEYEGY